MYLLDTNVVSELRKGIRANSGVRAFFSSLRAEDIYLVAKTIGELRRGVENIRGRGDLQQAELLEGWLDDVLSYREPRILAFDAECARVWGKLMVEINAVSQGF